MAMTLRLTEHDTERLRALAAAEGLSMQEVARSAISAYLDGKSRADVIGEALSDTLSRYSTTIRRLGE